jgi:hypothetical protein
MLKRIKGESGSVTIEATISLSAFMFAIVTLLTIVNICLVQARVAVAINTRNCHNTVTFIHLQDLIRARLSLLRRLKTERRILILLCLI